ncbi:stage V sporulation protein AD [Bacillus thermocopriae]|uniref:Stage V sporulation protein AD n=1 Tax=Neobacillus thermocopriae TaxID=1215031 RepID=A0A6B3TQ08_9BACI|nr:stage V sporulation protein AD [Neobacillus thermocopriae]MED3623143.1 stage V sporulation protein AD [Neobacillus thermocopriae]MED3715038.1 stage V sporulation protein AD [Neobacillus thermocopriae]NEX78893.1 stage V sporulation protein AD [Neobacillus thermocopriae]
MLKGHQSWVFENHPMITATGVTGGPFEANGNLAKDFDLLFEDLWIGQDSYEKAHRVLFEEAIKIALKKANIQKEQVQFLFAGDLINQITPSSFSARTMKIPYFGLFGACSTSMEGLALASFVVNHQGANFVLTGASSHNAAVEKQFRYPTEYGSQKPPTAQWTVTGAGVALVQKNNPSQKHPVITSATIGRVIDMGLSDPFNMGGAMAPAAADTIQAHFRDLGLEPSYYDLIITGDLGRIGHDTAFELINKSGLQLERRQFQDCGLLIYKEDQPVQSGASGAGCSATVLYGHLLNEMKKGKYQRILVVATGALLSPLTFQQNETIPCIAHAVAIEMID